MAYNTTAKGLSALGRKGDDTLLHVGKDELVGLQSLLGPISVNPDTGLPEAFAWKDVLTTALIGLAGAYTGGVGSALAGGGTMGALTGTALGAGTGALAGGSLSAAQGRGFGAGALGGAISGGMGGFGGSNLSGAPTGSTSVAVNPTTTSPITSSTPLLEAPAIPKEYINLTTPSFETPQFNAKDFTPSFKPETTLQSTATGTENPLTLGQASKGQFNAMGANQDATMEWLKPTGMGALLGAGAQGMVEQNQAMATQMRNEKLAAQANEQQQQDYFKDLGYPLAPLSTLNNPNTQSQFDYYKDIINPRGAAVGGSMNVQVPIGGTPVSFTIPPNYGSMLEKLDIPSEQNDIKNELGLATGGYVNTQPVNPNNTYPQSQIPSAQPYAASTPQRHEVLDYYKDGGFLDGPGDGMSDDIAANIDGEEEIRLADGEFVVPPDLVRMLGFGDPEEGAKLLDKLLPIVRQAAHGKKTQIKQDAGRLAAEKMLARAVKGKKA
jgi:hypothetical protein